MHSCAQTNIQLFNQLRRDAYSDGDLNLVRHAYESAMVLFSGRFQPSGKSFIAHVVGTASILAWLRLPAPVVAAALLHNAYGNGDFGDGRRGATRSRRRRIRETLGPEVEAYVAKFPALYWEREITHVARHNPDKLSPVDRAVLLILFADHLEHLVDHDVLYYEETAARGYIDHSIIAAEIAEKLGLSEFAIKLREAVRETQGAELSLKRPAHSGKNGSVVIVPKSCRKRIAVGVVENLIVAATKTQRKFRRVIKLAHGNLRTVLKMILVRSNGKGNLGGGVLEVKSEEFTSLFPSDARLERVASGFRFTEGPVWIDEEKALLFSDILANRIHRLLADGRVMTFREPSGSSNGLTRDKKGTLIACEHASRRVTRTEANGSIAALAESYRGKRLNSPNDVTVKSDGSIYFTDPNYGIEPEEQQQPVQGVYRLSPDGNELTLVADDFIRPNGLAFSPDEKKLYIDDSERRHIRVFDVHADGSLSGSDLFYDMNADIPGSPDGMKVDVEGRVYCTGARGIWVFDNTSKHLGTIITPEKPSNCAWGDDDRRSLYITAVTSVYKIRVNTPGMKV